MKIQLSLKESSTAGSVYSAPSMYSAEQLQPSDEELARIDKEEKEREDAAKKAKEKESKPQKTDAEKDGDDSGDSGDDEDDEDPDEEDDSDDSDDESDDEESDDEDDESDDGDSDDESDDEDDSDEDSDDGDSDDEEATASSMIAQIPGKIRIPFPDVEAYSPEDDAPESAVLDRDGERAEKNLAENNENQESNEDGGRELAQASSAPLTYPDVNIKPV